MPKIRLNRTNSVYSVDRENQLAVQLDHTTKKIPLTDIKTTVDQYEIYRQEAANCDKYRVTLTIKPYCTNVLFNTCTEVVLHNGGNENGAFEQKIFVALDDGSTITLPTALKTHTCGRYTGLTRQYMVDNTEYSSERVGFEYYPGYDIFGNHILRNLSFRSVIPLSTNTTTDYNTLSDYMRTQVGGSISVCPRFHMNDTTMRNKHLYEKGDILSFEDNESVSANLTNEDGWYGFINNSSIDPKKRHTTDSSRDVITDSNHVINNKGNCEFVDMYPDRTLYSFVPKVNEYKHRTEKNWDVFLTYPYENFYKHNLVTNVYGLDVESGNVSLAETAGDEQTNAILIMDANRKSLRSGGDGVEFRTYCKHNLKSGDEVMLYYSLNEGVTFKPCGETFSVNYIGDMKAENKDYYFAINDVSVINEIFKGRIGSTFYTEENIQPQDCREMNGEIVDMPYDVIGNTDEDYKPNIKLYRYKVMENPPQNTWNENNSGDTLPSDIKNGPLYYRLREKDGNGDYVYDYYLYTNTAYTPVDASFNPDNYEFGEGNTYDAVPLVHGADVIRVHRFVYYEREVKYYKQRLDKTVNDIINDELCYRVPLRFAKVVNGVKCKYYIRKFRKIPNLKYSTEELTDKIALSNKRLEEYIEKNASKDGSMRNFMNETYKLAFSKTIYNDDVAQIQFTDTLNLYKLRDNLKRPLTEIYATIVKKNVGYKNWYGVDGAQQHFSDFKEGDETKRVEFSHCFGKVTSGFEFNTQEGDDNDYTKSMRGFISDAQLITNVPVNGNVMESRSLETWGEVNMENGVSDGIHENDDIFFGDVVEYNPMTVTETTLSDVHMRFNTAQRENASEVDYKFYYNEIDNDDYTSEEGFKLKYSCEWSSKPGDAENPRPSLLRPEGYYYKAHNRIGIKQFSKDLNQASHYSVMFANAAPIQADGLFIRVETINKHGYGGGRKIYICDDKTRIWYNSTIVYVDSANSFIIKPIEKDVEVYENKPYIDWIQTCELLNQGLLRLRVHNENIPDYADNVSVNMFLWRNVIPAVESDDDVMSAYPYSNDALYIDNVINFYLKRQDPEAINGLYYYDMCPDIEGKIKTESNYEYIPESEVLC